MILRRNTINKLWPFLVAAVVLHAFIICFYASQSTHQHTLAGTSEAAIITTHFYTQTAPTHAFHLADQVKPTPALHGQTALKIPTLLTLPFYQHTEGHSLLLEHIHNLVQENQVYPQEALDLNESGSATVRFKLLPTGQIQLLQLIQSSGFEPLDLAAMQAVQSISPVRNVPIKQEEQLQVTVNFDVN